MLYWSWLARIHWAARITSLVRAIPLSSITSSETMPAVGAAPVYVAFSPAARPATSVPCPKPSPGELFGRSLRLTSARTRLPKSARPASIPESTKAMVGPVPEMRGTVSFGGRCFAGTKLSGQSWSTPTAFCQIGSEPGAPFRPACRPGASSATGLFGVTTSPGTVARSSSALAWIEPTDASAIPNCVSAVP